MGQLLEAAEKNDVVFLTADGDTRFALLPADEGDREVLALRANADFMAFLTECERRAAAGPRKSLAEMRRLYGSAEGAPNSSQTRT